MAIGSLISNERQAREASAALAELDVALSNERVFASIAHGLPKQVIDGVRKSLTIEHRELSEMLTAYNEAKEGSLERLMAKAGNDPGAQLIVARITNGLSQKDLARKLGLREQAVQRYEAERYRSISLGGFLKFASVLGLRWNIDIKKRMGNNWGWSLDIEPSTARKLLKHARSHGWLERGSESDEGAIGQLIRYVADHVLRYGTPSLLRTGLNVNDHAQDWSLLSWKARVTQRAEQTIKKKKVSYRPIDVSWLLNLVRLSIYDDGPVRAQKLLEEHGIILIAEPNIVGMSVDGAAFLVDDVPVIGITLLRDTLDNFWFTLLHEVAHIVLHYRIGLMAGFFDDFESQDLDEIEKEANEFASNILIPEEMWRRSPARIAKTTEPVENFARQLKIHPAIVFGRIRLERNDWALFSSKIGRNTVRRQLFDQRVQELS